MASRNTAERGWFNACWLAYAHHDMAFLLRLDVEFGWTTNRASERRQRNVRRNALLRGRDWYVVRFDARMRHRKETFTFTRAIGNVQTIARRHCRAIVRGSDVMSLENATGRRAEKAVAKARHAFHVEQIMLELQNVIWQAPLGA